MTVKSATPVLATDRVSDVLARDEALVEVFVQHAAHFSKLRNKTMRRVMARLVTVEQAARMAGVPTEGLLTALNNALGVVAGDRQQTPANQPAPATPQVTHPEGRAEVELDVRPDLRAGREPFSAIMRAVGTLEPGAVLHLRTTFEPVPLFGVLAKRGLTHEVTCHGTDDWSVWFWQPASGEVAVPAVAPKPTTTAPSPASDGAPTTVLDVRGMEPPEPMVRTLEALEALPAGHELVQLNVRVPRFLLPVLDERGFAYQIDESQPDQVLVRIRRR